MVKCVHLFFLGMLVGIGLFNSLRKRPAVIHTDVLGLKARNPELNLN